MRHLVWGVLAAALVAVAALSGGAAHAAPFTFAAADAATGIVVNGEPAAPGQSICAVGVALAGGEGIDTAGAACAAVADDGSFTLTVESDDFDGDAFLVLEDGSAASVPQALTNSGVEYGEFDQLELLPVAFDGSTVLLFNISPREVELEDTVSLDAWVFDAGGQPLSGAQVTFSFSGPGSPTNELPRQSDDTGLVSLLVLAGDLGTVEATASLSPNATLTQTYTVVEASEPTEDPLPEPVPGFFAWLGRDALASEIIDPGQILWKWDGSGWISYSVTTSGLQLGADFDLILGDVLFLGMQSS